MTSETRRTPRTIVVFPDGRTGSIPTSKVTEDMTVIGPDVTPGKSKNFAERNVSAMNPASEKRLRKQEKKEQEEREASENADTVTPDPETQPVDPNPEDSEKPEDVTPPEE